MPDDDAPDGGTPAGADQDAREGITPVTAESPEPLVEAVPLDPAGGGIDLVEPPTGSAADAYERRARLAEDRLAEVLAAYRKLKVDNDAYRGRLTKNLDRRYEQRRERLLLKFIDILDNLDRALEAAETTYTGEPMIEGLILVRTQLLQTLQDEGLERIPVLGLPYDPGSSEAVQTRPVDEPEHHHVVVKELMRGYRLNGRIARAARVVVGEHHPESKEVVPAVPVPERAATEDEPAPIVAAIAVAPGPPPAARGKTSRRRGGDSDGSDGEGSTPEGEPTLEEIIARAEAQEAQPSDFAPLGDDAPADLDAVEPATPDAAEPLAGEDEEKPGEDDES